MKPKVLLFDMEKHPNMALLEGHAYFSRNALLNPYLLSLYSTQRFFILF